MDRSQRRDKLLVVRSMYGSVVLSLFIIICRGFSEEEDTTIPGICSLAAARALLAVDRLGVYPDALAGRAAGGRGRPHAVLDLGRHRHERLLHVGRVLRRGLQEGDAQLVGVFLEESDMP